MDAEVLEMSADLADELASNASDTRLVPVRNSHLKQMGRSAAHCRYSMLNDWEPTLSMRLGSGVHSLLLGGPPLVVYPGKVRNGKAWDQFQADNKDALILSRSEMAKAVAMNAAVRADDVANRVLFADEMVYEKTILWKQLGRDRRCTPDAMNRSILVDLKTTRDASPDRFKWDAIRMGYEIQMGDYAQAFEDLNGHPPRDVYLIAVENKAPFAVTTWRLTPAALDKGKRTAAECLQRLLECEQTGVWPGYSAGVLDFDIPMDMADLDWEDEDDGEEQS